MREGEDGRSSGLPDIQDSFWYLSQKRSDKIVVHEINSRESGRRHVQLP